MIDVLLTLFFAFGAVCFYFGVVSFVYYPLALAYPFWERRVLRRARQQEFTPSVSVLVPAYNEARTIGLSLTSMLESEYPDFEVIVINDGSTDDTEEIVRPFLQDVRVRYLTKPNGGKASALNLGLKQARGAIVLFTDADSVFERDTIAQGVAYFVDPGIGAVSGNDTPLHPRGPLQRMLVVTSHIGTGFVRRALSMLGILQIIPGNLGLVRTAILRQLGGFREIWGEDLDVTLQLHRARVRVVYGASTRVLAECPHTVTGLWKQRVRWLRSYIKVLRLNKDMVGNPRFGLFGPFLVFNGFNMVVVPLLQWVGLLLLPVAFQFGQFSLYGWEWVAYSGLGMLVLAATVSILLDKTPRDLLYLPYVSLLIVFSHFYNSVVVYSVWAESRSLQESWNKLDRRDLTGISHARTPSAAIAVLVVAVIAAAFGIGYWYGGGQISEPESLPLYTPVAQEGTMAVAIHFDAWRDWRDAYRTLLERPESRHINRVAVSAGRADWTYFRWPGHEEWWSPQQRRADADMLDSAVAELKARGYRTTAIMDVFAAQYLARHPGHAAEDLGGRTSRDVVCSTVLAQGAYGDHLVAATAALAAATQADTIAVTELFYDKYCYDDRCLVAFRKATGRDDWPRDANGRIDRFDPVIGAWRSRQVATIVERLSRAVHAHAKTFALDVKVSRDSLFRDSAENGQDYRILAPWVDEFVVWDYFAIEGLTPESSARVAAYFGDEFGTDRFFLSVGLWDGRGDYITPAQLARAVRSAREGGARHLWITPAKELGDKHWRVLTAATPQAQGASRSER